MKCSLYYVTRLKDEEEREGKVKFLYIESLLDTMSVSYLIITITFGDLIYYPCFVVVKLRLREVKYLA